MPDKPWYRAPSSTEDDLNLCSICREIHFEWLLHHDLDREHWDRHVSGVLEDDQPHHVKLYWQGQWTDYAIPEMPAVPLGLLSDIFSKSNTCKFCHLVISAVAAKYETIPNLLQSINIDACPFPLVFCSLGTSRNTRAEEEVYDLVISLRIIPQSFHVFDHIFIHRLREDRTPYEGARVHEQINFENAREWVTQFTPTLSDPGTSGNTPDGFRLIDVRDQCIVLIEGSQSCRYLALSYVWGGPQHFQNTKANDSRLRCPGSLASTDAEIPLTIADAMLFVSRIGERYLWVDSLCIVQDDDFMKLVQINAMDQIYTSAMVTIVAMYGSSCHAGLPGVRLTSGRWKQHVVNVHGVTLANRQIILPNSGPKDWPTRGWTYQEHALSRRLIFFARDGIQYESEDGVTTEDIHQPFHHAVDDGLPDGRGFPTGGSLVRASGGISLLMHFALAVHLYSGKTLTYQTDTLRAFEGVLNVMRADFCRDFLYGMPSSELDVALPWRPIQHLERRLDDATGDELFPSWSWAGWRGPIVMPVFESTHFSRIAFVDAEDETEFTTSEWRGTERGLETSDGVAWQRKPLDIDAPPGYFRPGKPNILFTHPVSKPVPAAMQHRRSLKENSPILTFKAYTARISTEPGQGVLLIRKTETDRVPDPSVSSRTLFDRYGRFCGTAYFHGDGSSDVEPRCIEFAAISRTAYGVNNEAWEDPPEDDADVLGLREGYAEREKLRKINDERGAASYFNDYSFELKWQAYDVLALEWRDGVAYRVGVGFCLIEAFWDAEPVRKRVPMA
ncbi:HET-domain-containing protein [Lophium mytilinum]|uniref:HET-domain-containing protein n=1 Tax=Lophium mytilinum TaxID=390894 RepID=A0A6A6QLG7_9PEZI|nr:HET-domain-containing protein [Lophium mytilinum]